jgi:hypothetical protein
MITKQDSEASSSKIGFADRRHRLVSPKLKRRIQCVNLIMNSVVTTIQVRIMRAILAGCKTPEQIGAKTGLKEATVLHNLHLLSSGEDPFVIVIGPRHFGPGLVVSLTEMGRKYVQAS